MSVIGYQFTLVPDFKVWVIFASNAVVPAVEVVAEGAGTNVAVETFINDCTPGVQGFRVDRKVAIIFALSRDFSIFVDGWQLFDNR